MHLRIYFLSMSHIWRTTVLPSFLKRRLFLGTALAFCGAVILLYSGLFLSKEALNSFGIILFMVSMGLIALGLIPYRSLQRQENQPDHLLLDDQENLTYLKKGTKCWQVPLNRVKTVQYFNGMFSYGILMKIDHHLLLLPFFSLRTCTELKNVLNINF